MKLSPTLAALCAMLGLASALPAAQAAVLVTSAAQTYTQNFDTLVSGGSAAWANDSTLSGWSLFTQPAPGVAVTTYAAGTGSSNTGSFYSFGAAGSSERALGGVGSGGNYFGSPSSGAVAGWIAAAFTNTSGVALDGFSLAFDGEQWRNGGNTNSQTMTFEYGYGSTFALVSAWTAPGGAFDFSSPATGAGAGALDGNGAANRVAGLGGLVAGPWNDTSTLWLRWRETNDVGNDHGLAIDNLQLTAGAALGSGSTRTLPEPSDGALVVAALAAMALVTLRRDSRR